MTVIINIGLSDYKKECYNKIRNVIPRKYSLKIDYTYDQNLFCWIFDGDIKIGKIYKSITLFDEKYKEEFKKVIEEYDH